MTQLHRARLSPPRYVVALLCLIGPVSPAASQTVPPGAPGSFASTVSGSSVTLTWTAPATGGAPSGYTLDAGTGPGQSNVGSFPVGNTTVVTVTAPNGTYFVRVRATNSAGSSGPSNEITVVVGGAVPLPGQPLDLLATVSGARVTLTWQAPVSGGPPTGYVIDAGTVSGAANIGSFPVGASLTFSADAPPGTYFARVRALNASGSGPASNEVTIVVGGAASPGAPQNLQFTVSGGSVTLTWGAPAAGGPPSGYVIDAGSSAGSSNLGSFPQGNVTSVTVQAPPGTYYVRVRAQNAAGSGPASNEVVITVGGTPTSIDGTWNGTTSQGREFSFIVANSRVTTTLIGGQFGSCGTSAQKTGLNHAVSPGSLSFSEPSTIGSLGFSVNGTFAGIADASGSASITATPIPGVGGCSGTINVTWSAVNAGTGMPFKPGAPGSVTFGVQGTQVTINWIASSVGGAPSSYSIEIGTSSGASNAGTFTATATTFATTLPPGAYFARVRGVNASGTSGPSAEVQFTISDPPQAPVNLAAQVSGLTVTLTWSAPPAGSAPTGYRVEIGTSAGASNTVDVANATTQYSNSTLAEGTYYARVRASGAGGVGPASNEVTFAIVTGPGGNFNGTWNGTTAQGIQFAFIVSADKMTFLQGGGRITQGCSVETTNSSLTVAVVNASFNHQGSTPSGGVGLRAVGTFASVTSASGTLTVNSSVPGCSGSTSTTWTAANSGVGAPILPYAPFNFQYSFSGGGVNFTWQAGGSGYLGGSVTSYDIEIGTTSGGSQVGVFSSATTSYQHNGLAPGTYYARVKGRNASGTGLASSQVTFTVVALPGMPGPLSFSATTVSVTLNWTAPSSGGTTTSYDVEIGTSSGASDVGVFITTLLSYTRGFIGPDSQLTYYARVKARNQGGTGPPSNEVIFALAPGYAPLGTTTINGSTATINWTAPTSGGPVTEYKLDIGTTFGDDDIGSFTTSNTSYQVMGLATGTYWVTLTPRNPYAAGTAAYSNFYVP